MSDILAELQKKIVEFTPHFISGVMTFGFFWIGSMMAQFIVSALGRKARLQKDILKLLARSVGLALLILGLISGLGTMGINVSALVASLGLTGFALGFALKDGLSNTLAGILIFIYRPFRLGDTIRVTGFQGEIIDIDLRYTTMRSTDGSVLMPNSNLFN